MRIVNRLLAFLVALALAAAGVLTIIEVVGERGFSHGPVVIDWRAMLRWGQHNTWQALSVELACGITAFAGLVVLLLQLRRRRPSRIALAGGDRTRVALTRKGMAAAVRSAVLDVDGISKANVKVKHRRIAIDAASAAATSAEAKRFQEPVETAVREELDPLQLQQNRRIKVRVRSGRKDTED